MSYRDALIARIENSENWPDFKEPSFLDDLSDLADVAFDKKTIEGYLASLLIYHQLCDELVRLLLMDAQFFIQLSIFPAEINFPEKKRLMFGQLIDELKATMSFSYKEEFIDKCMKLNEFRVKIVHGLTKFSTLSDIEKQCLTVKSLYYEVWGLFEEIHDGFKLSFKDFKKDVFLDFSDPEVSE
jgi:hypothetical protein